MSLVNLAHVCSHLQNASLARLGLTSIPYTKLHLSLALLLQKQGFLSQVKLAGPSPPASCFGQGPRDDHSTTNHPHGAAGRNQHSAEAALALAIRKGLDREGLLGAGFGEEAVDFAQEHAYRSREQLEAQGWHRLAIQFIQNSQAEIDRLVEETEDELQLRRERCADEDEEQALMNEMGSSPSERRENVAQDFLANLPRERSELFQRYGSIPEESLQDITFTWEDLKAIAGLNAFMTEREIRQNGITINAMGLDVPNQGITLPQTRFHDPDMLEAEGVVTQANRASRRLWLGLKYYQSMPVLSNAKMISKPTKRIWLSSRDLSKVVRGNQAGEVKPMTRIGEIMAISTDKGIMEARECVERRIGGQPLCRVW
ncbi:hypothetical protein PRZ48_000691 [Zasmidium cellare]|uniref:Ribosomal protein S8 n=1 Tax=Zasmidium cellare TaxID=395010 RepID=A0ABR0F0G3_ZASCE|nr:hypothetical protein PRZ48_000691 [Zasmidium cellare]